MNIQRLSKLLESKDELTINEIILSKAQNKGQIIYGARAFNIQSPTYLRKKTYDYDILTKSPRKSAKETAAELRRRLNKRVEVVKGKHKGTYRVKLNDEFIVDYTQLKTKPKTKKVWGTEVRDIKSIKRDVNRLIKKPETEYRREKDIDTMNRLKEIERIEKLF